MATTTNYSWTTPDDTALVKDGAAAIRTLGSSIDTTTKALNPSTTLGDIEYRSSTANTNTRLAIGSSGQVLTVAAGVPSWANGFSNPLTTTGDVIYSSSGSTPARLGIGTTGQVLSVSGGLPAWATPSSGGMTLLSTTTLSGATTVVSSIDQTYINLFVMIAGMTNNTADGAFRVGINNSTNSHDGVCTRFEQGGSATISGFANNYLITPTNLDRTNPTNTLCLLLPSYAGGNGIRQTFNMFGRYTTAAASTAITISGMRGDTSAITSLGFSNSGGNLAGGTVLIYGVK